MKSTNVHGKTNMSATDEAAAGRDVAPFETLTRQIGSSAAYASALQQRPSETGLARLEATTTGASLVKGREASDLTQRVNAWKATLFDLDPFNVYLLRQKNAVVADRLIELAKLSPRDSIVTPERLALALAQAPELERGIASMRSVVAEERALVGSRSALPAGVVMSILGLIIAAPLGWFALPVVVGGVLLSLIGGLRSFAGQAHRENTIHEQKMLNATVQQKALAQLPPVNVEK